MTATVATAGPAQETAEPAHPAAEDRRGSRRQVVAYVAALAVIATAIIGGRVALNHPAPRPPAISVAHPAAAFPSSPAVEAAWGIRFTNVMVLADNGGVELRYQVVDTAKAAKIHQGAQMSNELPSIQVDGTSSSVAPSAVLMHFHHGDSSAGRTYSIIYGNAGGVVSSGEFVTVVMKDGLTIKHIQVTD